jgi:MscS family membrane protein
MRVRLALILLLAALASTSPAQIPGLSKSTDAPAPETPTDPLGRSTPRGTIVAFSRAVDREDFNNAALYLQLDNVLRPNAAVLASELAKLIDRELHESLGRISDEPAGDLEDGLAPDREQIGPMIIEGQPRFLTLARVKNAEKIDIWLISADTLREVPALVSAAGRTWIERHMPRALQAHDVLGLSLAHWIVLITILLLTLGALALIAFIVRRIAPRVVSDPVKRRHWDAWFDATHRPAIVVLTLIIQFLAIPPLGFPLTFRVVYARIGLVVLALALAWLLKRVITLMFAQARTLVRGKDRASTQSLMLLAERLIQALLIVMTIIMVLILLGVESKTALAALGVGGVALAFGAQKTVENLLGGIFLLSDKALAVGDYCTIGNQSGTVEDVTLRSVRLRTPAQTLVSLPAGSLAQTGIENYATRRKQLILTTLRLRYGTSVAQLEQILAGIRALLEASPAIGQGDAYIRLVNFGAAAIELELYAYVLTPDAEQFRAHREKLLLEIATLIEATGSALAPTTFVNLERRAD